MQEVSELRKRIIQRTAWRIDGTLREFPKFEPINLWFDYPIHKLDKIGVLKDINPDDVSQPWKKNFSKKKSPEEKKQERKSAIETAYSACNTDGKVTLKDLSEYMGVGEKTVRNRLKEHGGFWIDDGEIGKK